jgi:hypothetical protein
VTGFTTIAESDGGHWTLNGSVTGDGTLDLGSDGTLTLNGAVNISTVAFGASGSSNLSLETPAQFSSTLSGFGSGDTIYLAGIAADSLTYTAHVLTLFGSAGDVVDTLSFMGKYDAADFSLRAVGNGTEILFAGTDAAVRGTGLPDFMPQGVGGPDAIGGGFNGAPGAWQLVSEPDRIIDGLAMLHTGHAWPGS